MSYLGLSTPSHSFSAFLLVMCLCINYHAMQKEASMARFDRSSILRQFDNMII